MRKAFGRCLVELLWRLKRAEGGPLIGYLSFSGKTATLPPYVAFAAVDNGEEQGICKLC